MQRITVRLSDEQFEYLQSHEGEDTSSKLRSLLAEKKNLEATIEVYRSMPTDKPVEIVDRDVEKLESQSKPRLDPMERAKHYPSCPHEVRMYDSNFDLFFCAKNMEPPYTERKITYAEVTPERCKQCVDVHQRQKRLKAVIREKRGDPYSGRKARVDWGKAEGLPEQMWF